MSKNGLDVIQGPHCLIDIKLSEEHKKHINSDFAIDLVKTIANTLKMKQMGEARIIRGDYGVISIYQIVSTSHIIIHFGKDYVNADLFSCEPFDVDKCVSVLTDNLGDDSIIQYCQRNLLKSPSDTYTIPMENMNKITSNPKTFTHALINWYAGDEKLLGDIEHATRVINYALDFLHEKENLPPSNVVLIDVDPIPNSWDKGGFSGGYVNLRKQLTMHTFVGINGAYTDIMAHTFDLEKIISIIKSGFKFKFYEVDGIVQRMALF